MPIERILPYLKNIDRNDSGRDSDSSRSSDNDNISRKRGDDTLSVRGGANRTNKENSALFRKNRSIQRDGDESHNNKHSDAVSEMSDGRRSEFQSKKNMRDDDDSSNKSNTVA